MKLQRWQSKEEDGRSIRLEIAPQSSTDLPNGNWGSNYFQPQKEPSDPTPTGFITREAQVPAPEKKLTLFALRLAILEKAASSLGTLAFIWATAVLLGGFASNLQPTDFWIVTVILLIEGARIYSRSHELEWQHQATTWSLTSARKYSFRALASSSRFVVHAIKSAFRSFPATRSDTRDGNQIPNTVRMVTAGYQNKGQSYSTQRTWRSTEVPMVPYAGWVLLSRNVGRIFYWLQLASALACAVLSSMRIIKQDYGADNTPNMKVSLNMFYSLALTEALMFLMEKAYWNWKIHHRRLLEQVCRECNLGPSGMASATRFFYDSYSKCIDGSVFDGLNMDLVSFGAELLDSNSRDEQLIGARLLQNFTTNDRFAGYTLRKIGTSTDVIERLIEMLNWKNPDEEEIRRSAGEIVAKLAGKKQSAIRVAAIPGAMESISSLLSTGRSYNTRPHEIGQRSVVIDQANYEFSAFNLLGLLILKKLSHDHDNCYKMGNSRGLMAKIIDFTSTRESLLRDGQTPESQIKIVKRSLQLVKILVSATGQTGKMLRKEVSDIVFAVSNIREILQHGESHMMLQKLGIEVLTSLAMDEEAREGIGSTGGVIKLLISIFFKPCLTEEQNSVSDEAGEALAMLALENTRNCDQILKEDKVVERLISSLTDPVLQVNASRILTNLCAYSGPECSSYLIQVTAAVPTALKEAEELDLVYMQVVRAIMEKKEKLLEVSIGLATEIFRYTSPEEYAEKLENVGFGDSDFAKQLVEILKRYKYPEIRVPRIRRFVIELAIWLMKFQDKYIKLFKDLAADEVLKGVAETTSELERFNVFSGYVGLGRNKITVSSLVDTALAFMG